MSPHLFMWRTPFTRLTLGNSDSTGATNSGAINAVATLCPPFVCVKISCLVIAYLPTQTSLLFCIVFKRCTLIAAAAAHAQPLPTVANKQIQLSLMLALLTSTFGEYVNVRLNWKLLSHRTKR